jgi:hypothetical protein
VNNTYTRSDFFEFIPKYLPVISYEEEDIYVKININYLNKLLDNYYIVFLKVMRVDKVHAGKFVIEVGDLVVTI